MTQAAGGSGTYERLIDKTEMLSLDKLLGLIGNARGPFDDIDAFLTGPIKAERTIKFDAHSQCWKLHYSIKREYICDIIAEEDAFTLVTRLPCEMIEAAYDDFPPYAKERIDSSPYRHRGWIEYRVLRSEHLEGAKMLLHLRIDRKG